MWKWFSRLLSRGDSLSPKTVRIKVPLDRLIQKMQEPKDIRLTILQDGSYTGFCKSCAIVLKTSEQNDLIWYRCPGCQRLSFNPVGNLKRDIALARQNGGQFEYEIFFFRDLPPGFIPPEME